MTRFLLLLAWAVSLTAQEPSRVGVSVHFSVPFTGVFREFTGDRFLFSDDRSGRWMAGPALRLQIADSASLVVSAIQRRVGEEAGGGFVGFRPGGGATAFSLSDRGFAWDFSLVGRYRLSTRRVRPFVTAGPSLLWMRTDTASYYTDIPAPGGSAREPLLLGTVRRADAFAGITAGAGVEHLRGRIRLTVEARCTHWFKTDPCHSNDLRCLAATQGAIYLGVGL